MTKKTKFVRAGERRFSLKWIAVIIIIILIALIGITHIYLNDNNKQEQSISNDTANKEATNLLALSERYYGNSVFWVYIFEENDSIIDSPVNIPDEVELKIPDLSERNINTSDSTEINKAKIKAEFILSNRK